VPVIDVGALLGVRSAPARLLTVRAGDRVAALAVDEVSGVAAFDAARFTERPPLLTGDGEPYVQALALKDREVYLVLDAARVITDAQAGP
jgi:chemotaxis signal transduction protein